MTDFPQILEDDRGANCSLITEKRHSNKRRQLPKRSGVGDARYFRCCRVELKTFKNTVICILI